jgi:D-xylonolactonase
MNIELIADYECRTGENPLWLQEHNSIAWEDIDRGYLFSFNQKTGKHEKFFESPDGAMIGGFTCQEDGALLLFMEKCAVKILRNGKLETVIDEIPEYSWSRFNDVIADPKGRVFCGVMRSKTDSRPGCLLRLDTDGSYKEVISNTGTPNGMGFSKDLSKFYFTDSTAKTISVYDYDADSGEISNRKPFLVFDDDSGAVPDGMTIDSEGCFWIAFWGGSCLKRFSLEGKELERFEFPTLKVSSVTFGGERLSDLYVTTAGGDKKDENGADAGALFRIKTQLKGVPEFRSKIKAKN